MRQGKKSVWVAGAAVLASVALVAGCGTTGGNGNAGGSGNNSGGNGTGSANSPITIGVVTSLTGALAAYGQEWQRGFKIGLQYATNGTDTVDGHKINVIWKDDNTQPNQAVTDARSLLGSDKVNILAGGVNSASAIAMEPIAKQYKTVYVVGPAVADSITGADYNKYIFKVSPNSYMEAKAAVLSIPDPHATVAQLAPNYAFGWDSVKAFKQLATAAGMKDVLNVYADPTATDFTPQLQKIIQAHPKYLFVTWAGAPGPWKSIQNMQLQKQGITVVTGIPNIAATQALFQGFAGMRGFTTYYYKLPNNPVNNYLISHDQSEFHTVPDLFDPDGMAAAIAIVDGLKKTGGNPNGNQLSAAMSGMSFQGPKGTYTFRASDHQALQAQYGVVLKQEPGFNYPVPTLTKVIPASATVPPVLN
ncbi:substrate-binding domain-containing protein [Alicyclobacillus sp. ALC3]|uniref:substrate-binding domain-containing protein n=1 Tax=Alicyclobacillus sp. ALC3 TaxID=2796143 RepID=UPI0023790200|nr:substrate-binding domain-containing protein [Alicyclobacillus sp. ALC3]WDL98252.1 substrate-binding domain-containing protein [Alicyclobacillus sp. ALC3]